MQECSQSLLFDSTKLSTNTAMDNNTEEAEEDGGGSPFVRIKSKVRRKMDDLADDISREIKDELNDKRKQIQKAENVAYDLVDPDTLDRLKEIIFEKPEIEEGCDFKLWYHITTKTITYVILKVV